ncbi:hypothetical protein HPP92_021402 [Vanilla planifolia]|uniref:Uncharacterized protein n=1 Tax=Vanilla planifolia TaxID=51239 RepID=A0A835UKP5_VANPL|nr:hypothetical protein HPP92_021402 [Vanilla planifolia]
MELYDHTFNGRRKQYSFAKRKPNNPRSSDKPAVRNSTKMAAAPALNREIYLKPNQNHRLRPPILTKLDEAESVGCKPLDSESLCYKGLEDDTNIDTSHMALELNNKMESE